MRKKMLSLLILASAFILIVRDVEAQEEGTDCDPSYVYCFDWENAVYSEVDGTYCDENACAYPPTNFSCVITGSLVTDYWCAIPKNDLSECDSEPMTCASAHTWTIPPPPGELEDSVKENSNDDVKLASLPPASTCAAPKIIEADIRVTGELVDPPYPVVVGQDPNERGADLRWRVELTPVIYTWYETKEVGKERICFSVADGSGKGCPGPASKYGLVFNTDGWQPSMAGSPNWYSAERTKVECIEHVEVYPVQLTWVRTYATLSEESRDWIEHGGLQIRYPGAHLYQPDWQWLPPILSRVLDNGTYVWEWTLEDIQFRDPGQYGMSVRGAITGTPVTEPRFFDKPASGFSVWMYEATLIQ